MLALIMFGWLNAVHAFTATITAANPRTLYLQVGVGAFTGQGQSGGTPGTNTTINQVSVTVPSAQVTTGTAQAMSSNSGATASFYDGFAFCNVGTLYVGGYYRYNNNSAGAGATLTATSPANLTNADGDTIPFTQITWTSAGNGDTGAQPFPAGTFVGGTQTLGTIARNRWSESCHSFSYLNATLRSAGTYTGRVTYTLAAP